MLLQEVNFYRLPPDKENPLGSDWWRKWREFSGPITWQSIAEPKEFVITFDT